MSEYDDKMKALRAELPQAYELKGQGEAGTGTITVPKGMTGKQEVKYREAVQRRMNPDIYKKLDAAKKAAQEEHTKKIGKTRPTYFPKQEEDEATAYVRRAIAKVHQKEPVSGPVELSEEDEIENAQMNLDEARDTGDALASGELSWEDWKADTGLPPLKPGQKIVQTLGPDGRIISQIIDPVKTSQTEDPITAAADIYEPHAPEGVDTSDEYQREEFGLDASEQQYDNEYADQEPAETTQVTVDGKEYEKRVFDDGAVFYVTDDGDVLRQKNRTGL
jgi:hypothetical protein